MTPRRFSPGERVRIREVLNGRVWTIRPVTVIEDSDVQVVTWLAPGTLIDYPVGVSHGEKCLSMWLSREWELARVEWRPPGVIRIAPHAAPFEVFVPLSAQGTVTEWYVNFERPLERTAEGFDTMDEILDLVVSPDLLSWRRKDEDELALAVAMNVVTPGAARRITESCRRVEEALAAGDPPWDCSWASRRGVALLDEIAQRDCSLGENY